MKWTSWAFACALSSSLFIGNAMAQGLRQPLSVRPAGFDYDRYLQDEVESPSDQPAPAEEAAEAPAAAVGSGCGCEVSCDSSCCDNSCGSSCGCGCGFGCSLFECNLGDAYTLSSQLFCEDSAWDVGGWFQFGYHNKANAVPDPITGTPIGIGFNTTPGGFDLTQGWLYIDKAADGSDCNVDWGFHMDLMYGVDAKSTNAFGNPVDANGNPRGYDTGWIHGIYGWALPQLYGEVAYGDWSVKAGHFYTIIGYEVVQATGNFFYSHAYTMFNSEPFTHTGVLATYSPNDNVEVWGGWSAGWDTGFDRFGDGSIFLGGAKASLTDDISLAYATTIGDFGFRGSDAYMHSVVADFTVTDKVNYVFQSDWLDINSLNEQTFGINNYLFYTVSDCVKLGARVEWWKTDEAGLFGTNLGIGSFSMYEATFGVNIIPHANMRIRPEIRQNWGPAIAYDQTIFAVDVITTY